MFDKVSEKRVRAQLMCTSPATPGTIEFDFNPESIRFRRVAEFDTHGSSTDDGPQPAGAMPALFKRADPAMITIDSITFEGIDTKPKCDQLLNWLTPGGGMLDRLAAGAVPLAKPKLGKALGGLIPNRMFKDYTSKLPKLVLNWGPPVAGFYYEVYLKMVTAQYVRFSPVGVPVRAKVMIELQEVPNLLATMPTNPTSGGLPGRAGHAVAEKETMPGIALEHYGTPGDWRRIAEVNDVDDPLRLRPGEVLYLPNPDELPGEVA
jgi:hypothetical protein